MERREGQLCANLHIFYRLLVVVAVVETGKTSHSQVGAVLLGAEWLDRLVFCFRLRLGSSVLVVGFCLFNSHF
jgi:hypothetical protein